MPDSVPSARAPGARCRTSRPNRGSLPGVRAARPVAASCSQECTTQFATAPSAHHLGAWSTRQTSPPWPPRACDVGCALSAERCVRVAKQAGRRASTGVAAAGPASARAGQICSFWRSVIERACDRGAWDRPLGADLGASPSRAEGRTGLPPTPHAGTATPGPGGRVPCGPRGAALPRVPERAKVAAANSVEAERMSGAHAAWSVTASLGAAGAAGGGGSESGWWARSDRALWVGFRA